MIVDFRRNPPALPHSPSWTALWLQWSHSDSWAPQFIRTWRGTITMSPWWKRPSRGQLRKFNLPQELQKQFYSAIIESVLCMSITVWFSSATKSDLRRLRIVVWTAERIIGTTLPTLQELYSSRVSKRAGKITLDPSHPAHSLFELWPSGRSSEHKNDQTQKQFFSPSNPSHEHLILNVEHTTLLYNNLFTTYFFYFYLHRSELTHNCQHCILCVCHFVHCLFVYCYFVVLSCCYHSVALWSFWH